MKTLLQSDLDGLFRRMTQSEFNAAKGQIHAIHFFIDDNGGAGDVNALRVSIVRGAHKLFRPTGDSFPDRLVPEGSLDSADFFFGEPEAPDGKKGEDEKNQETGSVIFSWKPNYHSRSFILSKLPLDSILFSRRRADQIIPSGFFRILCRLSRAK
jgi:hypothetical protein